jgi:hypothetical protein
MATILIVEDEEQVLVLTESYLREQGHQTVSAATAIIRYALEREGIITRPRFRRSICAGHPRQAAHPGRLPGGATTAGATPTGNALDDLLKGPLAPGTLVLRRKSNGFRNGRLTGPQW